MKARIASEAAAASERFCPCPDTKSASASARSDSGSLVLASLDPTSIFMMFPIESFQLKNYLLALHIALLPLLEFANQSFIYLLLL
jgi:hypothetical protein